MKNFKMRRGRWCFKNVSSRLKTISGANTVSDSNRCRTRLIASEKNSRTPDNHN